MGFAGGAMRRQPPAAPAEFDSPPVEIAGLAARLQADDIAYAVRRAQRTGVGADEVLLAMGIVTADDLGEAAARTLGIAFVPLAGNGPAAGELRPTAADLAMMLRSGLLRLPRGPLIVAARGPRLRALAMRLAHRAELRPALRLSTPERLADLVRRRFGSTLAEQAAFGLRRTRPRLSAGTLGSARFFFVMAAALLAAAPLLLRQLPGPLALALAGVTALMLLGWSTLRLAACLSRGREDGPPPLRDDRRLPAYSLIVPLYREARIVPQLVAALEALDYPAEKLQILLVIEPDDPETAAALARHARAPRFGVLTAPALGPRTKPKALNAALPFARGDVIGIYDAEDIPDPDQLRRVCALFAARANAEVGCVQARIAIDNVADSWITRQFAAEYAGHFDVLLPLLGSCRLPFPLGGTSNHFRREALEAIGGWDPYNVTEDADLGVRLVRHGWKAAVIASTTGEEAPRTFRAWLRQRTRWYKGWMQTVLVHGRDPRALLSEAGVGSGAAFMCLMGGGLMAALVHPFFLGLLIGDLATGRPLPGDLALAAVEGVALGVFLIGYSSALLCTAIGMGRRRLGGAWRVLPLVPAYWLMMSLAAWRAALQLLTDPQLWEKTDHGLARGPRRRLVLRARAKDSAGPGKALREVSGKASGKASGAKTQLAAQPAGSSRWSLLQLRLTGQRRGGELTNSAADRRPLPRAGA